MSGRAMPALVALLATACLLAGCAGRRKQAVAGPGGLDAPAPAAPGEPRPSGPEPARPPWSEPPPEDAPDRPDPDCTGPDCEEPGADEPEPVGLEAPAPSAPPPVPAGSDPPPSPDAPAPEEASRAGRAPALSLDEAVDEDLILARLLRCRELVEALRGRALGTDERRQLEIGAGLVDEARTALDQQDVGRANALSTKALVLIEDLAGRR